MMLSERKTMMRLDEMDRRQLYFATREAEDMPTQARETTQAKMPNSWPLAINSQHIYRRR